MLLEGDDLASARQALDKGMQILESMTDELLSGRAAALAGQIAMGQGQFEEAERDLRQSREILSKLGASRDLRRVQDQLRRLPKPGDLGVERIVAFEENLSFLYLCGVTAPDDAAQHEESPPPRRTPLATLVRKILLVKPAVVLVDDQVHRVAQCQPQRDAAHDHRAERNRDQHPRPELAIPGRMDFRCFIHDSASGPGWQEHARIRGTADRRIVLSLEMDV